MSNRNKEAVNEYPNDAEMRFIVKNVDTDNRNFFFRKYQSIYNLLGGFAICYVFVSLSLKIDTEILKNEKFINKNLDTRLNEMMSKCEKITRIKENRLRDIMLKYGKLSSELQAIKKTVQTSSTRQKVIKL